jgi:hypothetical protein
MKSLIDNWAQVIDRWVRDVDEGVGGRPRARLRQRCWMPRQSRREA